MTQYADEFKASIIARTVPTNDIQGVGFFLVPPRRRQDRTELVGSSATPSNFS